ncbi:FGGY-family carbohydrate kinase [Acidithiobacillus concretivorus]|uniref:FGGY-family carbohydrate kinase n=1 Tax=Acidithiobacillus concretivorus TaxID=3063952 RepID=A0ABS5ZMV3_9PROT|nr:FGGY-family carbohydrate kinase [Acidithiobacillus concretivorus]MBU2737950.1 FGGY-family carbohydrate kinase [Acidithiobacillus concretivorus]
MPTYLGMDFGTSGLRGIIIDENLNTIASTALPYPGYPSESLTDSQGWLRGLEMLAQQLRSIHTQAWSAIKAMSLDGTSGTLLLSDRMGKVLGPVLAYSDQRAAAQAQQLKQQWPAGGICLSPASSLSKLLWLRRHLHNFSEVHYVHHQADWIAAHLIGHWGISDRGNVLKMGLDAQQMKYPEKLLNILETADINPAILPKVMREGMSIGTLNKAWAQRLGLSTAVQIRAGCTDSVAAAAAAGLYVPGTALSSLGSSLAFKVVHDKPIHKMGLYSHYLGDFCLVGAASNAGASALLQHFQREQMRALESSIHTEYPSAALLYPLAGSGERFPILAPTWPGSIIPTGQNTETFQKLLEGLSYIEAWGYDIMEKAGVSVQGPIKTVGGGSINAAWMQMRAHILNRPVEIVVDTEAAKGSALIAASADLGGLKLLGQMPSPSGKLFYPAADAVQRYAPYVQKFQEKFSRFAV